MSEFWKRKIRTYFRIKDLNKDGVITKEDFNLLGSQLCEKEKASPERQKEIRETVDRSWKAFTKSVRKGDNEPLTESVLIESVKQQRNDPEFVKILEELAKAFMNSMDSNQDGFLQEEEYGRMFEDMGFHNARSSAKVAFDAIDTNHDGKLGIDEITRAYIEFMLSEDENSPYRFFWGPLVQ